jgi:hypothetical protein
MPNYGDSLRAISTMRQSVNGTAASTYQWKDFVDYNFEHEPNIDKDVPEYATYSRWVERDVIPKKRNDTVHFTGRIDTTEIGWDLTNAFGAPTYTSGTKLFEFLAGIPSPPPYLTTSFMEGITNLWWQGVDSQVTEISFTIDTEAGTNTFDEKLECAKVDALTSPPTPTYSPPADSSPFDPGLTVVTLNAVGFCVTMLKITISIESPPFYCTPTVPPTSTTERGLKPTRYLQGKITGTYELRTQYTGDANSPFYDYRFNNYEAIVVTMYDPYTDLGSGIHPRVIFTIPRVGGTAGNLDRSKPNVNQVIKGRIMKDATLGTGIKIGLVNNRADYAGS